MQLRLIESDSTEHSLKIQPCFKVRTLRKLVWEKTGVPWAYSARCQRLFVNGAEIHADNEQYIDHIDIIPVSVEHDFWINDNFVVIRTRKLVDGDIIHLIEDPTQLHERGDTYLHAAADFCCIEGLKTIIEKGEDVSLEKRNNKGFRALHSAGNYHETTEFLIGAGAHPNGEDRLSFGGLRVYSPLMYANSNASESLLCGGAKLNNQKILLRAVSHDQNEKIEQILESGGTLEKNLLLLLGSISTKNQDILDSVG